MNFNGIILPSVFPVTDVGANFQPETEQDMIEAQERGEVANNGHRGPEKAVAGRDIFSPTHCI